MNVKVYRLFGGVRETRIEMEHAEAPGGVDIVSVQHPYDTLLGDTPFHSAAAVNVSTGSHCDGERAGVVAQAVEKLAELARYLDRNPQVTARFILDERVAAPDGSTGRIVAVHKDDYYRLMMDDDSRAEFVTGGELKLVGLARSYRGPLHLARPVDFT